MHTPFKTIHKYTLDVYKNFWVNVKEGAEVLSVGMQHNNIVVWARVNPDNRTVARRFPVYGTGNEIAPDDDALPLIGTVFQDDFVWHVFDAGEA